MAQGRASRAARPPLTFAQGKEYAGQERATAGGALSRGHFDAADRRHLQHLQAAQEQAFKIFTQFADPRHVTLLLELSNSPETAEFRQLRAAALEQDPRGEQRTVTADAWFEVTTRRIDAILRQTAMSQNKRIFDVAQAIISMADIFRT